MASKTESSPAASFCLLADAKKWNPSTGFIDFPSVIQRGIVHRLREVAFRKPYTKRFYTNVSKNQLSFHYVQATTGGTWFPFCMSSIFA